MGNKKVKDNKFNFSSDESDIFKFRKRWLKKGYELIDITQLCKFKLGRSGSANGLNEPNDEIYHIQGYYREEEIAVFQGNNCYIINENKYLIYATKEDFVLFKKAKIEEE